MAPHVTITGHVIHFRSSDRVKKESPLAEERAISEVKLPSTCDVNLPDTNNLTGY